jgi:hypothetical protein
MRLFGDPRTAPRLLLAALALAFIAAWIWGGRG